MNFCFKSREMELEEGFHSYEFGSEELSVYQDDNEFIAALRQKEEEVVLAAHLRNALLLENRQLKEERNKLHEQYEDKIDVLEQDRHMLQLKLQRCWALWESQEAELQRDVWELSAQVEALTKALATAEQEKSHSERWHEEQSNQLQQQLNMAVEVERAVTVDLQDLQQEMRDRGNSRPKDEELLWTLKQQLVESQQEVELERRRNQELQSQIEELQGRTLVQQSSHGDTSLLSEKVHSLDTLSWGQDKEQVTQEVSSILDMLLPVSHGLEAPQHQDDTLQGLLGYLRIAAERIVHIHTVQNAQLIEENTELQLNTCSRLEEIVQRAIKDRDDAIAKKTAVEAELVRTRNDMMCLNNQLLDAVQHKLQLSQELEAWQDDIQVIINQQLRSQQQTQPKPERKHSSRLSFLHKTLSTSPTCTPNASPAHVHSPWREWFKLGK